MSFGNSLAGAGTGAAYGSSFGLPGALIGGGLGFLGGLFGKKKKKPEQLSTFNPQQQGLFNQYAQGLQGEGQFADLFGQYNPDKDRELFQNKYAKPAYANFKENVVPGITGQFRGGNLQNSSYLGGALAKAGSNVQQGLDTNMMEILQRNQQAQQDRRQQGLQSILGMNTFDYKQQQPDMYQSLMSSLAGGAGQLLSNRFNGQSPQSFGG